MNKGDAKEAIKCEAEETQHRAKKPSNKEAAKWRSLSQNRGKK